MILLDTCALLWVAADQTRLSESAKSVLAANPGELFVSSVSAFELAEMHNSGEISLPMEPLSWFQRALTFHGFRELPVTSEFATFAANLPPLHNDFCDRLLIGTAMAGGMTILTPDPSVSQYPQAQTMF